MRRWFPVEPVRLRPTKFSIRELEPPPPKEAFVKWIQANLDKLLAAATALLALGDWRGLFHAEWAVVLLAVATFAAEWLKPKVHGSPPAETPPAQPVGRK